MCPIILFHNNLNNTALPLNKEPYMLKTKYYKVNDTDTSTVCF